jgi:hypothetical protein
MLTRQTFLFFVCKNRVFCVKMSLWDEFVACFLLLNPCGDTVVAFTSTTMAKYKNANIILGLWKS